MRLQAPADALAAALIGGLVLLILYVLKLRRRPLRIGDIRFWTPSQADAQANEPFQRLRPSWLLALHALIVAVLSLAAGRPVLSLPTQVAHARTILIIDASASMNATDTPGSPTRLERAKRRASELAATLTSDSDQAMAVIAAAAQPSLASPFTTSTSLTRTAIDAVTPTDQPGDLAAAFAMARTLASTTSEARESSDAGIILLTDGVIRAEQASSLRSPLPIAIERMGPAPGAPSPLNRGITRLAARRDARSPDGLGLFIEVMSNRDAKATQDLVSLSVRLGGRVLDRRAITVPLHDGDAASTASVSIDLPAASSGLLEVALDEPDALACDDAAAMVIDPPLRPSLLLVQPRDDGASHALLRDVVAELGAREVKIVDASGYEQLAATRSLGDFDCIVFDGVSPRAMPARPTMIFGADCRGLGVSRVRTPRTPGASLYWNRAHPLLESASLDALVIEDDHVLVADEKTTIEALISSNSGPLLGLTEDRGTRRIAAAFDLSRSNWLLQPSFPIFMAESLRMLLNRDEARAGRSHGTTQAAFVRVRDAKDSISLKGPVLRTIEGSGSDAASGVVSVGVLSRAGTYAVAGTSSLDAFVTSNLEDRDESSLKARTLSLQAPSRSSGSTDETHAPSGRPVWGELVMLAVVLLGLEWLVFARGLRT